jgi:hypothetical protein
MERFPEKWRHRHYAPKDGIPVFLVAAPQMAE